MEKKYLITAACTLTGIGLGYWGGYARGTDTASDKKEDSPPVVRRMFGKSSDFERGRKALSSSSQETASRNNLLDMDVLFNKYSRMTSDQIRDEVGRLQEIITNETMPPEEANTILYALCYRWGQLSPKQALEYADSMTTGMSFCHAAIIRGWSAENPEAAFNYYQENKKDAPRSGSILEIIARGMAHASPDGAVKWLDTLEEKDKRHAFPSILTSMAREHPERLSEFAAKLPLESLDKYGLYTPLVKHWTAHDWNSARQWIQTLPPATREAAMMDAIDTLVAGNTDQATQAWKELPAAQQKKMAERIVRQLADKSAIQSLEWIARNADDAQALALTGLVLNYGNSASREVKDYALNMPEGPGRDCVLEQIVNFAASYHANDTFIDCAENMALTDQIKDTETRTRCREGMIYAWARENPEQAELWIQSIPSQERDSYMEKYREALKQARR